MANVVVWKHVDRHGITHTNIAFAGTDDAEAERVYRGLVGKNPEWRKYNGTSYQIVYLVNDPHDAPRPCTPL